LRFNVGSAILLGSADNLTRFVETLPIATTVGQGFMEVLQLLLTEQEHENSYTASSVLALLGKEILHY
jgi:hypothetical protein